MHKLSRREALRGTGVAALAAGVAVVPFVGGLAHGEGELTALIKSYREGVHRLNTDPSLDGDEGERFFDGLTQLLNSMVGVPVRSRKEAVMAIDFVFEDSKDCMIDFDHDKAYAWLLKSARDFIAEEVRS